MNSLVRKKLVAVVGLALLASSHSAIAEKLGWRPEETTIADVHAAMRDGTLTTKRLVEMYLARMEAYDKKGPALNAVILVNPKALEIADDLDAKFKASGPVGRSTGSQSC
jgi:amidase